MLLAFFRIVVAICKPPFKSWLDGKWVEASFTECKSVVAEFTEEFARNFPRGPNKEPALCSHEMRACSFPIWDERCKK
jgi:hypothetical protein